MKAILLTKGYAAIIDRADWPRVKKYKWHVHMSRGARKRAGQPYARATIKGKKVYLHRFVTGAFSPLQVDHKNHCTLDCRQINLEITTHIENQKRRRNVQHHALKTQGQDNGQGHKENSERPETERLAS